jgi:hypothetical protein
LQLEFEERERWKGIVFLEHARTSTQDGRTLLCDEGIAAEDSPWLRCLRASGLGCLKERLAPAGVFLEISWRCRKSADVRDLGGAYGGSGSGRRRE